MTTWTDENGDVVASTTFTDAQGRRYINGVEVPEAAWAEYKAVCAEIDRLRGAIEAHRDTIDQHRDIYGLEPADARLWAVLDPA